MYIAALKRKVLVVILSAFVVGLYGISNILRVAVESKVSPVAVYAAAAEAIIPVEFGFLLALVLYIVVGLLESILERRAVA